MKKIHFVLAGILLCTPLTQAWSAKATLVNAKGQKIGEAKLKETKEGVEIALKVSKL